MAKAVDQKIYQIKVTLAGVKPAVWRRLLVPSAISLRKFHEILQIAMGWEDSHLHALEPASAGQACVCEPASAGQA